MTLPSAGPKAAIGGVRLSAVATPYRSLSLRERLR